MNRYLSQKRKASEGKYFLNSKQLYEPLKSYKLLTLLYELSGITKKNIARYRIPKDVKVFSNLFLIKAM